MEIILPALAWGVAVFVLFMLAAFISRAFNKNKLKAFQAYAKQSIPSVPDGLEMFAAKQKSKGLKLDIVLILNDSAKNLVVLQDNKGEEMKHTIHSYTDLVSADSTDTVISRGALPKQYSYERTLTLTVKDGSSYKFIQEYPSNKHGNDKGSNIVKDIYAPWEAKLKAILE